MKIKKTRHRVPFALIAVGACASIIVAACGSTGSAGKSTSLAPTAAAAASQAGSSSPAPAGSSSPAPAGSSSATPSGASSSGAAAANGAAKGMKTGWIYDGSIEDKGYDQQWYEAQQKLTKTLGIEAQFVQNEPYTSQWTATGLSMVNAGAKMLFDPGDGGSLFYAACAKAPKVDCVESNGVKPFPANVVSVYDENWQATYLEGMAAGLLSKKGVIGFLAAFPNTPAPVMEWLNSMLLGCQATHPGCRAIVSIVNSWYDPPKETEEANALVSAGADVLASTNNDDAAVEVAQKRGVWGVGSWGSGDQDAFVTSQLIDWAPTLTTLTQDSAAGKFPGGTIDLFGLGHGLTLAPWGPKVPATVQQTVGAAEKEMLGGKNFFCGPISDNTNKLRVPKGTCLTSAQIYDQWDWYVQGVSVSK